MELFFDDTRSVTVGRLGTNFGEYLHTVFCFVRQEWTVHTGGLARTIAGPRASLQRVLVYSNRMSEANPSSFSHPNASPSASTIITTKARSTPAFAISMQNPLLAVNEVR